MRIRRIVANILPLPAAVQENEPALILRGSLRTADAFPVVASRSLPTTGNASAVRRLPSGMIWGSIRHGWIPYSRSPQDHVGWTNIWHSAMRYISKDRPGKTTDIEPKLPHLSSFGVRTKNFGEVLGNFYKMQATEQRLLSFPSGSAACSLNELSFNVFASFHSGSSRNPSRDEGTREE